MKKFLLAGAAVLALAASAQAQTYLIGGIGFEQFVFDGFTYDANANALGSVQGLYTDLDLKDSSQAFPNTYVARATAYWDGSNLSSSWLTEDGLNANGSVGRLPNLSTTGELPNTTARQNVGNTLYFKGLDSESVQQFANPGATSDGAIGYKIANNSAFSFVLDTTNVALSKIDFTGFMQAGASADIAWSYSLDGVNLVSTGITSTVAGTLATVYSVDLSALSGVLSNDSNLVLVGTFASGEGTTIALDNVAFIGSAAVIPEPSTYAALLGAATVGFVVIRRRKAQLA